MKKFAIGASLAALIAIPALAYQASPPADKDRVETRAEVAAQVKDHFARMDINKDGVVTQDEIKAGRDARMKERADQRFAALDTNKDGQISRAEFDAGREQGRERFAERRGGGDGDHKAGAGHHRGDRGDRMRGHRWGGGDRGGHGFAMMDANKDGKVTLAEATAARLAWFDKIDTNKDGKVTSDERKAAFAKMRAEHAEHRAQPE